MSATSPLRIVALTRRYGRLTAVDQVDLEVRNGEIVGFLGPNGAGKTTTLKVCAGLLKADQGQVTIAGASLEREPRRARSRLGFVPDRPFLYDRLSAFEFVEFVGALYDVPAARVWERAEQLFERLGLGAAANDRIETYSHGMRQKASVAAALVHDPPLALLDEPLTGLDPRAARALKDLLRERAARGLGVLVSTHLLEVAERLCDRVVILHRGRVIAQGTLDELRGARSQASLEDVFLELTSADERDAP
ncbi:MAG: ABC transporter ATP-binding protein [Candidatus Eisenbacteria bacterium]|uniref:ABC transporter ATP-binding protein n=1 Tax=Eiseniibacteriota bacterium TaxID=2212470 RepID=A0A538TSC3_UNCEI|nr:MAG: ABC transporter ATP-binding protein [Candidatus Eisenbacteria bacterium]